VSKLSDRFIDVITIVAATCAIFVVGRMVKARFTEQHSSLEVSSVPNWPTLLSSGDRIGPAHAAVAIVEFGDFQCPACAWYSNVLDSVRTRYPNDFAVVFHHLPLPGHPLAYPLARASLCAERQGRFPAFYDTAYRRQGDLGLITVSQLGLLAGPADSARFLKCAADTSKLVEVDRDVQIAQQLGVAGTPTIIVDGKMYPSVRPLTFDFFARLIDSTRRRR